MSSPDPDAPPPALVFDVEGRERSLNPSALVVAGYTARDVGALDAHIAELAEAGVSPPSEVPMYWPLPADLLTQDPAVAVPGPDTTGEVELALLVDGDEVLITIASDHTDRRLETVDIGAAKAACPKPIAGAAWPWAAIEGHWELLGLGADIVVGGKTERYQDGAAGANRSPLDLLAGVPWPSGRAPRCLVLLCGTVPVEGRIRPADRFAARLDDPIGGRSIDLAYTIDVQRRGPADQS